jgi:integrase
VRAITREGTNQPTCRASVSTTSRHTHASVPVGAGVPIKVVSERLGPAHPAFTIHTYQHLLSGMSAAAAEQFAALVDASSR